MANDKRSKQKEEHCESKTESNQPIRTNKTGETSFRESTRKTTESYTWTNHEIISKQLDIKLGPFTQEELDSVLRKIKNRKTAGLVEIPPDVWKTRQFVDILFRHCNAVYNQNSIDRWMKGCILPFPKMGDLGKAKKYRGITLTSIAAKIYNALLHNRIESKLDNILLYGWTTWTLTKYMKKKLDGNYTRTLRAILNKFWRQHPTKQQLYGHQPPITRTIQVRRTIHAGHCWRSRDGSINDILLRTLFTWMSKGRTTS